ncbi:DNA alkylation repair protein [Hymenobacter busanensis]|uniref:DNA alkylation repair protein n=1 Tax=Hymenobacter busanensis TaxID=2607656 RepID=A0A7L4ZTQ0_9BACT|nr:DNA alkylation repair protein [Hymenobacter busanensis]KAA9327476.1 DNA alkylation repair protein [Hymenobacter busanensis]QHJ06186.1 DNA alkylation repair protein [Hymenobacter busanensis]
MTFEQTFAQLQTAGTEQTRKTYQRHGAGADVFGVSFAQLGQLKKQFVGRGKDKAHAHAVAQQLWNTQNFDAQLLATMIADAAQLTPTEAENWAAGIRCHMLADAFAALVATAPFADELMQNWISTGDELRQRIGYALLNRLALQDTAQPDTYFEPYVRQLEMTLQQAPNRAKEAMNNCLIGIGSRNEALRRRVESAADRIGPVTIDHGDTACQTFEIRPYLAKVWARKAKTAAV